jgi:hypothetical protein
MHALLFPTLALLASAAMPPTVVIPMFHSEIVRDSELIAVGTVTGATSRYEDGGQTIRTYVDVKNLTFHKGAVAGDTLTLRFDGGQVGKERIEVVAMPKLRVGGRYLLYVSGNGRHVSPITGFNQGVFEISVESGREVLRDWRGLELIGIQHDRYVFAGKPVAQRAAGPQIASIDQTVVPARKDVEAFERELVQARRNQQPAPLAELPPVATHGADPRSAVPPQPAAPAGATARDAAPIVVPAANDRGLRIDTQTLLRAGR